MVVKLERVENGKMENTRIRINRIKCLKCGDIITSETVHDFKWCSCHSCAVDGGTDYLRRCGNPDEWEDMSEIETIKK